ncbi:MAG: 2-hydroxyacid dehydrogenase [Eubacteriales bacterium]|nr:2-hydroxyacid dehydrogenase [Eubacteriales bacterium]
MKIAFFDTKPYDKPGFEKSIENNDITIKFFEAKLCEDTVQLAEGYDVVCIFVNDIVNKEVIDKLYEYGVKLVALRCAGYNNVDVKKCYKKIHVVHVPAYSPYAVAEHSMGLLLTLNRRIHKAYIRTKDFNFSLNGFTGFDLHGKTVGIIGTGKIGCVFGDICRGFGMRTVAYDSFPKENSGFEYLTLDELYEQSDIISLHCPLTAETKHMIDEKAIAKMKKGVVLINTSRGGLIDTESLIKGIKERKIGAAGLDVYEEEGNIFFNDFSGHIMDDDTLARLISMPNIIVTGHQAFLTQEALNNIAQTTIDNIISFFSNDGVCENELCYHCGQVSHCQHIRDKKCF